jgi:hypothetical protein
VTNVIYIYDISHLRVKLIIMFYTGTEALRAPGG